MLTYELKKAPGVPLYEALYRKIREDILTGKLAAGEKLPSKRALSANLEISKITVEAAYDQLLAEGFIRSTEKVGYFVEPVELPAPPKAQASAPPEEPPQAAGIDLTHNAPDRFPFSVWSRLHREVLLDLGDQLLQPIPNRGVYALREAICRHLAAFRGMSVSPENILIGAGTDFLYNLLIQLLGREKRYALEEPGYEKIRRIYAAGGVSFIPAEMDGKGVTPASIENAQVLHISPSHHFPTGLITPPSRRAELLEWAGKEPGRYIIEDDYDSEFRFNAHPMPAMQSMDRSQRVIYMNTFSKSLAPSIRISYMVLPPALMEEFQNKLGFYSCTVPSFEQYTLARFLSRGYFEKHINRMRKAYRARRNQVMQVLERCPLAEHLTIQEQDAGLHFLVKVDLPLSGEEIRQRCLAAGILIRSLGDYFHGPVSPELQKTFVVNYASLDPEALADRLKNL